MGKFSFDNIDLFLIAIKLDYHHKSTNMVCLAVQHLGKQKPKSNLLSYSTIDTAVEEFLAFVYKR